MLLQSPAVVKVIEPEVEERCRDRPAVDDGMAFVQVPASRPHHERRRGVVEGVVLAFVVVLDGPGHGIDEVGLAVEGVAPGRRVGVFEVGHEHPGSRVEGVDHHLSIHRTGDLDSAVDEVGRGWGDAPIGRPNLCRLGREVGQVAGVDPALSLVAGFEEFVAPGVETVVEGGDELDGLGAEDRGVPGSGGRS